MADKAANSFQAEARELLAMRTKKFSAGPVVRSGACWIKTLPHSLPVADVTAPELQAVLRRVEHRRVVETAHRARPLAGQALRYASVTGWAERNSATDLTGALPRPEGRRFASVTEPAEVAPLLRALHGYEGTSDVLFRVAARSSANERGVAR